jgi:hypothetical protein
MSSEMDYPKSKSRLAGWILFVACLLLLSFGATPYHKIADMALMATRSSLVLLLSILIIRERWSHRHDLPGGFGRPTGLGERVLHRVRRWYYDEQPSKESNSSAR